MFQLRAAPFTCPYQVDLCCPVSVVVGERDPDRLCMAEAIPCHRCPHYLTQAQTLLAQRRVQLGSVGRQLLALAREQNVQCYPLTATLRTHLSHRVDLHRVRKAVRALVAVRAVRTFRFPAAIPRADNPQHLIVRETLWVQITAVGEILGDVPGGRHCAGWRQRHDALAACFRTRYEQLATTDLFALYVEQVVAIVTAVTHQLVVATDAVMVARCAAPDSPYVGAFVHLDAVAPDACAQMQQMYLRVQDARQRAVSFCHAPVR